MQNLEATALILTLIGTLCWIVVFGGWIAFHPVRMRHWKKLQTMTARIEKLSRAEHDLIRDVHPQVSEIKEHVENV